MFIDQQQEDNLNKDSQSQIPQIPQTGYSQDFLNDYDLEQENLEIQAEQQNFSKLFDELLAYSINPQEETQTQKKKNIKISFFRRGSNQIMKKRQEKRRIRYSKKSLLQTVEQRDFNDFKQSEFQAMCMTLESQGQEGEWQENQQKQVQEQVAIPLGYSCDDQNLMLLNVRNIVNINDNCNNQNNNEINKNKLLMNALLIPNANAIILPNL
ncbi:unnamed protein product [Paramecium sonneborni]|uniref:Uncharacterized protein n=1 Tax=Paramecium sonneborni TaxID=65129 RepID=A0A8S1QV04_9CILI|nr:unnamed protein product [Paramecium sonneborni]